MQPLFSIVMPVYGVEKYLEKAVRSVIGQRERDWEMLLVDDASPDESGVICDRLAAEDPRISVIHLAENGGLSRARNAGMKAARGKYLMFMDSDDWVDETLLEGLAEIVRRENAPQMIVLGVMEEHFDSDGGLLEERRVTCPAETLDNEQAVRECALRLERATLLGYAWNKLYDMELINNSCAEFEAVPLIEDILFNLRIIGRVERMKVLDSAPYHYARRASGSLTRRFLPYYYELSMRRVAEMLKLYAEWGMKEQAVRALAPIYARYALSALQRNCDPQAEMTHEERRKFVRDMLESELYKEFSPQLKQGGGLGALPGKLIGMKNEAVCLFAGRMVYIVSTKMRGLFVRLSGRRGERK